MNHEDKRSNVTFRSILSQIRGDDGIPLGGCQFLQAEVPLDPVEAKKLVPFGMRLTDPPMATLTAASYETFPLGSPFRESALNIRVKTPVGKGAFCAWIVVDDDRSLIGGREFLAYPKKMADFSKVYGEDHISATVSRLGKPLFEMEAERLEKEIDPAPVYGGKHFNLGGPGQCILYSPLWLFRAKETIHESYHVNVSLKVFDSDRDPLARIISGGPVSGRFSKLDSNGVKYLLPIGFTGGLRWFVNSFALRYR